MVRSDLDPSILSACEAVLMVVDTPVLARDLAESIGLEADEIVEYLTYLRDEYAGFHDGRRRGFDLRETGAGWRIYSASEYYEVVSHFVRAGKTAKLSGAALETLAVIAYRQPVTRSAIQSIRGVSVDGVVRTLVSRELICEAGVEPGTGATLYTTTSQFLERMGLQSMNDLPHLAPALPDIAEMEELAQRVESSEHGTIATTTD